ncbi:winged helix DNA-binding protein [Porphyrobacter sp. YT40]|uniref:winged helix DNA-binding protein n=1 Tax=Porphyrobacter sp. YT40 TaxID=2547601 RepID=UPI0015E88FB2|nr:winged helix DNA-binding protein [Porphyrobacter sp. YT40]
MKLASECTDCLTAFMQSRLAGAQRKDSRDAGSVRTIANDVFDGGIARPSSGWKLADFGAEHDRQEALAVVESIMAARKARLKFFDDDLFFDPTWAMLLDLYRSDLKGTTLSVSSLCIGSGVPSTTALRYIRTLEERGYIRRAADELDKRRIFVMMTDKARDAMNAYVETVIRQGSEARPRKRCGASVRY